MQEASAPQPDPSRPRLGRYILIRPIGSGGMATVYEAEDPDLHRRVALKVIREDPSRHLVIERLHREATAVAKLRHPGIVSVHEVGTVRGEDGAMTHFIAMDYVDGKTLDLVAPSMSRRERVRAMETLSQAVAYAHSLGVVHRDLKPQNVLLETAATGADFKWRIFLTDFGLARVNESKDLTRTGSAVGTPYYMSPEQVKGDKRRMGPPSDVWALGVMLYELLTGKMPFKGRTALEVYDSTIRSDPTPLRLHDRTIHADLETICLKALSKEPLDRYITVDAWAADLRCWLAGEPIAARPQSAIDRVRGRLRKNPWLWAAGALAIVALAGGIGLFTSMRSDLARQRTLDQRLADIRYAYVTGDLPRATQLTEDALTAGPAEPAALRWHARLLLRKYQAQRGIPEARLVGGVVIVEPLAPESDREKALREQARRRGSGDPLIEGALLLWEGRYDDAIARLQSADDAEAPLYRALARYLNGSIIEAADSLAPLKSLDRKLTCPVVSRILLARGQLATQRGEKPLAWFDDALVAAEQLEQAGEAELGRRHAAEVLVAWGTWNSTDGVSAREMRESAIRRFEAALAKLGGLKDVAAGDALTGIARTRADLGNVDPTLFDTAIAAYQEAQKRDDQRVRALIQRGHAHFLRHQALTKVGKADLSDLAAARAAFEEALAQRSDLPDAILSRIQCTSELELATARTMPDRVAALEREAASLRDFVKRWDRYVFSHGSYAHACVKLGCARQVAGQDPIPDFEEAARAFEICRSMNKSHVTGLANVRHNMLQIRLQRGGVEAKEFDVVLDLFTAGTEANPANADGWSERGNVYFTRAQWRATRREDPLPDCTLALDDFERAGKLDAAFLESHLRSGYVREFIGDFRRSRGEDPGPSYEAAMRGYRRALEIHERFAEAERGIARVQQKLAR